VRFVLKGVVKDQVDKALANNSMFPGTVGGNLLQDQLWNCLDAEQQLYPGAPVN
jgi:hypothetical protein